MFVLVVLPFLVANTAAANTLVQTADGVYELGQNKNQFWVGANASEVAGYNSPYPLVSPNWYAQLWNDPYSMMPAWYTAVRYTPHLLVAAIYASAYFNFPYVTLAGLALNGLLSTKVFGGLATFYSTALFTFTAANIIHKSVKYGSQIMFPGGCNHYYPLPAISQGGQPVPLLIMIAEGCPTLNGGEGTRTVYQISSLLDPTVEATAAASWDSSNYLYSFASTLSAQNTQIDIVLDESPELLWNSSEELAIYQPEVNYKNFRVLARKGDAITGEGVFEIEGQHPFIEDVLLGLRSYEEGTRYYSVLMDKFLEYLHHWLRKDEYWQGAMSRASHADNELLLPGPNLDDYNEELHYSPDLVVRELDDSQRSKVLDMGSLAYRLPTDLKLSPEVSDALALVPADNLDVAITPIELVSASSAAGSLLADQGVRIAEGMLIDRGIYKTAAWLTKDVRGRFVLEPPPEREGHLAITNGETGVDVGPVYPPRQRPRLRVEIVPAPKAPPPAYEYPEVTPLMAIEGPSPTPATGRELAIPLAAGTPQSQGGVIQSVVNTLASVPSSVARFAGRDSATPERGQEIVVKVDVEPGKTPETSISSSVQGGIAQSPVLAEPLPLPPAEAEAQLSVASEHTTEPSLPPAFAEHTPESFLHSAPAEAERESSPVREEQVQSPDRVSHHSRSGSQTPEPEPPESAVLTPVVAEELQQQPSPSSEPGEAGVEQTPSPTATVSQSISRSPSPAAPDNADQQDSEHQAGGETVEDDVTELATVSEYSVDPELLNDADIELQKLFEADESEVGSSNTSVVPNAEEREESPSGSSATVIDSPASVGSGQLTPSPEPGNQSPTPSATPTPEPASVTEVPAPHSEEKHTPSPVPEVQTPRPAPGEEIVIGTSPSNAKKRPLEEGEMPDEIKKPRLSDKLTSTVETEKRVRRPVSKPRRRRGGEVDLKKWLDGARQGRSEEWDQMAEKAEPFAFNENQLDEPGAETEPSVAGAGPEGTGLSSDARGLSSVLSQQSGSERTGSPDRTPGRDTATDSGRETTPSDITTEGELFSEDDFGSNTPGGLRKRTAEGRQYRDIDLEQFMATVEASTPDLDLANEGDGSSGIDGSTVTTEVQQSNTWLRERLEAMPPPLREGVVQSLSSRLITGSDESLEGSEGSANQEIDSTFVTQSSFTAPALAPESQDSEHALDDLNEVAPFQWDTEIEEYSDDLSEEAQNQMVLKPSAVRLDVSWKSPLPEDMRLLLKEVDSAKSLEELWGYALGYYDMLDRFITEREEEKLALSSFEQKSAYRGLVGIAVNYSLLKNAPPEVVAPLFGHGYKKRFALEASSLWQVRDALENAVADFISSQSSAATSAGMLDWERRGRIFNSGMNVQFVSRKSREGDLQKAKKKQSSLQKKVREFEPGNEGGDSLEELEAKLATQDKAVQMLEAEIRALREGVDAGGKGQDEFFEDFYVEYQRRLRDRLQKNYQQLLADTTGERNKRKLRNPKAVIASIDQELDEIATDVASKNRGGGKHARIPKKDIWAVKQQRKKGIELIVNEVLLEDLGPERFSELQHVTKMSSHERNILIRHLIVNSRKTMPRALKDRMLSHAVATKVIKPGQKYSQQEWLEAVRFAYSPYQHKFMTHLATSDTELFMELLLAADYRTMDGEGLHALFSGFKTYMEKGAGRGIMKLEVIRDRVPGPLLQDIPLEWFKDADYLEAAREQLALLSATDATVSAGVETVMGNLNAIPMQALTMLNHAYYMLAGFTSATAKLLPDELEEKPYAGELSMASFLPITGVGQQLLIRLYPQFTDSENYHQLLITGMGAMEWSLLVNSDAFQLRAGIYWGLPPSLAPQLSDAQERSAVTEHEQKHSAQGHHSSDSDDEQLTEEFETSIISNDQFHSGFMADGVH